MRKPTTAAVLLALALPAPAAADSIAVPPGNSEADQYFETVPGLVNPRSPDSEKTVEDAVREGRLSPATAQVLEQRGEAGEGVARIVAQTAPVSPGTGRPGSAGAGGRNGSEPGGRASGAAALSTPDEQGMGVLFPLIAVALLAGATGYAIAQWRSSMKRRPAS